MLSSTPIQDESSVKIKPKVESEDELPTTDEQLERAGIGNFQYLAIFTFVLFIMTDGMELLLSNIVYRAMPRTQWGMTSDDRARLVSTAFLGFVVGQSLSILEMLCV